MELMTLDEVHKELDYYDIPLSYFGWALREILEIHKNHGDCRHPAPNEDIKCKAAHTCDECQYLWPCRTVETILKMKNLA